MIKVISASDDCTLYINHRKIEMIKEVNSILQIRVGQSVYIVKNSIDDIKAQIINFESQVLKRSLEKEVIDNGEI